MSDAVRFRHRAWGAVGSLALVGSLGIAGAPAAVAAELVVFGDADLQRVVNSALSPDRDPDAPVTTAEATTLTELWAGYSEIDVLTGIERLTGLTSLAIDGNRISDLAPLRALVKLRTLTAGYNAIVDTRPLASLPVLKTAQLWSQQVTLPALATTSSQSNPLRAVGGGVVIPTSGTAVITASGSSWRLRTAGTHTLSWWVTGSLGGSGRTYDFDGTITQAATGPNQLTRTPKPKITGTARVGGSLSAAAGSWDSGVSFGYQWLADGSPIPGATSRTLTLSKAQHHRAISVKVTGRKTGFSSATTTSAATPKTILAPVPVVKGSPALGKTLTVLRGSWTSGSTVKLQWYADKIAVPGATKRTFTVTSSQQGKVIVAKVTGSKSGYAKATVASKATAGVRLVDTTSRASVAAAYKKILAPGLRVLTGWTGSTSGCRLGTESSASRTATLNAVNFVRAMNQLDGVRFTSTWTAPALRNSLMMQARNEITHYPSKSGKCWSKSGATAAARSNLYLGNGWPSARNYATGARAIVGYMDDPGASNIFAGHRRWIIEPSIAVMATGSTSKANTLTVMGKNGPSVSRYNAAPDWMEWPSAGWFPKQLDPEGLWSLSSSDAGVDFRSAKVSVKTTSGKKLSVSKYPVADGYGPNTMTWKVSGVTLPKGSATRSYVVTVTGIRGGPSTTHRYTVKMFDPYG